MVHKGEMGGGMGGWKFKKKEKEKMKIFITEVFILIETYIHLSHINQIRISSLVPESLM